MLSTDCRLSDAIINCKTKLLSKRLTFLAKIYFARRTDVAHFTAEVDHRIVEFVLEHEARDAISKVRDFSQLEQKPKSTPNF